MVRPARAYDEKVKPYLKEIRHWRNQDMSIVKVAERLGVTQPFLNIKMKEYPELKEALQARSLTEDELRVKAEKEALYRRRYLNSTKSFIRRQASLEEKLDFIHLIFQNSSEEERKVILKKIKEF
ncbi:MAG TPA: hypothetical protein DCZ00_04120 [Lactococcus sp.]|uniref:hypothetical protein n=1 Tax=unclassified Lactococcus TaxID=2643510 RepID=UPI000E99F047|nr:MULTISPECIES: hypothetical protein [unclassified Lactococcus]HAP15634.1 hypothetical protein [Lactococcus sp.]HBC90614.1 hypothetical protein [Lactococcus sp.]